jgi:hypothetical protein
MTSGADGRRDFDFLHGRWAVHHRRLSERGRGSEDWQEFGGTADTRPLLGGLCNVEEHAMDTPDFSGAAFRTFDVATRLWSIAWVSALRGRLEAPVVGSFAGAIGRFEGEDEDEGCPIRVRFLWDRSDPGAPRWEQSFSYDGGADWELNWVMQFRRRAD